MQSTKNKCYTRDMPNFDIFDNEEFQSAFKNQTVHVARKAAVEYDFEWDEVFKLLDIDIRDGKPCGKKRYADGGYRILNALRIPNVLAAHNKLLNYFKGSQYELDVPGRSGHLYVNITTIEGTYGWIHADKENVVFWNVKGRSKWTIYEKTDYVDPDKIPEGKVDVEVILEPGDVLFCPYDRPHKVEPLTPRFGVSLGFGEMI